jgi:AcrR family transcriptional regulator
MSRDTRSLLVAAAAELLDKGGPSAVTLRDVGRLAGVSHNAPYKHFADKEDLLAAVAARELTRQAKAMAARPLKSPKEMLRSLMHGYVRWARANPQRFKLTFGSWTRGNEELGGAADSSRQALIRVVAAAQAKSELPKGDPERLTVLFLSLANGAADLALNGHLSARGKGHADPEDLIDDLLTFLGQGTSRVGRRKSRKRRVPL